MKKIADIKLDDLLPEYLRGDKKIQALSKGIEEIISDWNGEIPKTLLYKNIDKLPDWIINELLWEWHVDFIDDETTMAEKRGLLKTSWNDHARKGTPASIESALNNIFDNLEVYESRDYGGEPYRFKLITEGQLPDTAVSERITLAVKEYKNRRSHFDGIVASTADTNNLRYGGVSVSGGRQIDYQAN